MNLSIRNQLFQVKKKPHPATAGCLENFKELKPPEPPTKSLSRRAHVSFGVVSSTVELRGKRYMEKQDPWQVWWKELRCVYPQTGKITIYHKLYKYRLYIRCGIYVYILYIYIQYIYIYSIYIYILWMDILSKLMLAAHLRGCLGIHWWTIGLWGTVLSEIFHHRT